MNSEMYLSYFFGGWWSFIQPHILGNDVSCNSIGLFRGDSLKVILIINGVCVYHWRHTVESVYLCTWSVFSLRSNSLRVRNKKRPGRRCEFVQSNSQRLPLWLISSRSREFSMTYVGPTKVLRISDMRPTPPKRLPRLARLPHVEPTLSGLVSQVEFFLL